MNVPAPIFSFRRLHDLNDGQIELCGELEITSVVTRHGHDCAGSVAGQDVVSDPNGDPLVVDWIDGISTGENTGFFLCQVGSLKVRFFQYLPPINLDCACLYRNKIDQRMFRSEYQISRAEQ